MASGIQKTLLVSAAIAVIPISVARAERFQYGGTIIPRDQPTGWFHGQAPIIDVPMLDIPTHYGDGRNTFQFVRSNPVSWRDPSGLSLEEDIDELMGDYEADVRETQGLVNFMQRFIARGNFLSMAYAQASFAWGDVIWERDEAILLSLVTGAFFASACFEGGTLVWMADGELKPIESVVEGDWVFCADKSGHALTVTSSCEVARTFRRQSDEIVRLAVESDIGPVELVTTPEHPFFSSDRGKWIPAKSLLPDELVWTADGLGEVSCVETVASPTTVFNFEVRGAHTYFVTDARLWVHNACTLNQAQQMVRRGKAPRSISRFEKGKIAFEIDHVHFTDGSALYKNGTWKHGGRLLSNAERQFLQAVGWALP